MKRISALMIGTTMLLGSFAFAAEEKKPATATDTNSAAPATKVKKHRKHTKKAASNTAATPSAPAAPAAKK